MGRLLSKVLFFGSGRLLLQVFRATQGASKDDTGSACDNPKWFKAERDTSSFVRIRGHFRLLSWFVYMCISLSLRSCCYALVVGVVH